MAASKGDIKPTASEGSKVENITQSILKQMQTAPFACGGSIQISEEPKPEELVVKPVQIRFGPQDGGCILTHPADNDNPDLFNKLLAQCQPATFGRGQKDVLDESYRKASKLDTTAFVTDFCPYSAGIIDVVAQLLLPKVADDVRGVYAELYKLNVYSAPSGKFKAHVDTPRSEQQFGSLVVCLPIEHEGGALVVRHGSKEMVFDWSNNGSNESCEATSPTEQNADRDPKTPRPDKSAANPAAMVKWAAFYSDCAHEVLEVTSGHRLTLTYNLYISHGNGLLAGQPSALNSAQLEFYHSLKAALGDPMFIEHGRVLGVGFAHAYAHTSSHANLLPHSLRGVDMYLYEVVRAAGLTCWLRPVVSFETEDYDEDDDEDDGEETIEHTFVGKDFNKFEQSNDGGHDDYSLVDDLLKENEYWPSFRPSFEMDKGKVTWVRDVAKSPSEAAFGYLTGSACSRLGSVCRSRNKLTEHCSMAMKPQARPNTHKLRFLCTFRRSGMVSVWMAILLMRSSLLSSAARRRSSHRDAIVELQTAP